MKAYAPLLAVLWFLHIPCVLAGALSDPQVITYEDTAVLRVSEVPGGGIELLYCLADRSKTMTIPRDTDSFDARALSYDRLIEVQFYDVSHVWLIARLSRNVGGAFLFDLESERFVAEISGAQFRISPSGRHILYRTPYTEGGGIRNFRIDGLPIEEEGIDEQTVAADLRWTSGDILELDVMQSQEMASGESVATIRMRITDDAPRMTDPEMRDVVSEFEATRPGRLRAGLLRVE